MLVSLGIILAATLVVGVLTYLYRRRYAPPGGVFDGIESADGIFGVVGTGFAVLLGFVIFASFGSYQAARDYAGEEAVAVRQLATTAGYFEARDQLRKELVCYSRSVVHDEWSLMSRAEESPRVEGWVLQVEATAQDMPVPTEREAAALQHWLDQGEARQDARRGRLTEGRPFIPDLVWAVLFLLTVAVLGFQMMFVDPRAPLVGQIAAMTATTAILSAAVVLVWVLDRPFSDRGAQIQPFRLEAAIGVIETLLEETADDPTVPCTATGAPR